MQATVRMVRDYDGQRFEVELVDDDCDDVIDAQDLVTAASAFIETAIKRYIEHRDTLPPPRPVQTPGSAG